MLVCSYPGLIYIFFILASIVESNLLKKKYPVIKHGSCFMLCTYILITYYSIKLSRKNIM